MPLWCFECHATVILLPFISFEEKNVPFQPETTAFAPGLKLKIITQLQNSVCVPSVQVKSIAEVSLAPQGNRLKK